jgi:prolyl 4-hydroxylase
MSNFVEFTKEEIDTLLNENPKKINFIPLNIIYVLALLSYIFYFNKRIAENKKKLVNIILVVLGVLIIIINMKYSHSNYIQSYIHSIDDNNYKVIIIKNLLSEEECDKLLEDVNLANKAFQESEVSNSDGTQGISDYRKSKQVWLKEHDSEICRKITNISKLFTGCPEKNMEDLQVVEYDTSGYFKEHYDPETTYDGSNIKDRAYTLIFYLNNVEEGGETYFKNIDTKVSPKKGDAVFFKSLSQNNKLLHNSLHQGMPVIKGKKHICNKWIHLNTYVP